MGLAIVSVVLLIVLGSVMAFVGLQGMWGAALTFVNVLVAALLATNYWEPAAKAVDGLEPSFTYLVDYIVIWALFCIFLVPLRLATDFVSRVKVKFPQAVDTAGGYFFGFLTAWTMICFIVMTMHLAPLSRNYLDGFFQPTPESHMLGVAPDRKWLAFMQHVTAGPLARSAPAGNPNAHVFDPKAEFIMKYGQRRANFEKEPAFRVNR